MDSKITDDWIEVRFANGLIAGWLPTDVARDLGIEVTENRSAITQQQRQLMQAHSAFEPAKHGKTYVPPIFPNGSPP